MLSFSTAGTRNAHGSRILIGYKGQAPGYIYGHLKKNPRPVWIIPYPNQPVPCNGLVESLLLRAAAKTPEFHLGVFENANNGR